MEELIMLQIRAAATLDGGDFGWLKARHHFKVAPEGNPANRTLGSLLVWNDDEIAPGHGFDLHGHANMEIITYVRQGTVTHRDSIGNEGLTRAGDVQAISAGTGIRHSEVNLEQALAIVPGLAAPPANRRCAPVGRSSLPECGSRQSIRRSGERVFSRLGCSAYPGRRTRARR
jgi:redox-sensitive bicupin YhaK (pirin superfamily)